MRNLSNNVGAGLRAKPTAQIDLGAEFTYAEITDQNHLSGDQGAGRSTRCRTATPRRRG
jgi:hypothetical protein